MAEYRGLAQAMGMILAPYPGFGFAHIKTDILIAEINGVGNARATVVLFAKQTGYGQANASLLPLGWGIGQAQVQVI